MAQDLVYYFDKTAPYNRHELGEIQTDFNMSIVIDGTKDSLQIEVYSFVGDVLTPNTIIYHSATQTWWCVKRDSVKRYASERGNYYHHNLTLNGAIDLLGSRDLTDCGFNDKTYSINTFLMRLFTLSNFEYSVTFNYGNNIDYSQMVDYIKSFENYTLLSALREFLNGYNCDAKMSFTTNAQNQITGAVVKIISKTGDIDLPQLNIDVFDDIRENKDINKESYATSVISNANNVASTISKTYPEIGGIRLYGTDYQMTPANAFLKLPSPIYKLNWVRILHPVRVVYGTKLNDDGQLRETMTYYPWSEQQTDSQFRKMAREMANSLRQGGASNPEWLEIYNWLISHKNEILNPIILASQMTIKGGWRFNPTSADFVKPNDPDFHWRRITKRKQVGVPTYSNALLLFADKETRDSISYSGRCMYYNRGEDTIHGFNWMSEYGVGWSGADAGEITEITTYASTDLNSGAYDSGTYVNHTFNLSGSPNVYFNLDRLNTDTHNAYIINTGNTYFQVNYIPMSDLKIKKNNNNKTEDIKLYNQNGKLNDSIALSKLIDGYSKEIENETITRYMHYNSFSGIPQIGQMINNNGKNYVISNISYDFLINESSDSSLNYYIECQFTLSPFVATKSLMVNPNSNIRDYGIPQKYNVKRKQLYRDYYNFTYEPLTSDSGRYVDIDDYTTFGSARTDYSHTAIIKITYEQNVNGKQEWYYQLNTTSYILNKAIYEVVDFGDNNIIGYDMQNTTSGFKMNRLYTKGLRTVSTPISYVDDNGKFQGIYLAFVNKENLENLYNAILEDEGRSNNVMVSSHVFVGTQMYNGVQKNLTGNTTTPRSEPLATEENAVEINGSPVTTCTSSLDLEAYFESQGIDIDFSQGVDFDFSISNVGIYGGSSLPNAEIYSSELSASGSTLYMTIIDKTSQHFSGIYTSFLDFDLKITYDVYTHEFVYQGAKDICDYLLSEPAYGKDAIEVPVFEYSLQVGDTLEIESGNNLIQYSDEDITYCYGFAIVDKNKATQLNALKYADQTINETYIVDTNQEQYSLVNGVRCTFIKTDGVSTGIRLNFYNECRALYKLSTGETDYVGYIPKTQSWAIENMVGKDLIIYRYAIRTLEGAYEKQVMFILHNVPQGAFKTPLVSDNSRLEFAVNYRKLK